MESQRLYKREKLCSLTAIESLFSPASKETGGNMSVMAYPWRAVWSKRGVGDKRPKCPQFLISVPKRRLRHAVDRVRMRRVMREAYRLNRHLIPRDMAIDIAFVYVAPELTPYKASVKAVTKILKHIADSE